MASVAREAGVGKATLCRRFATREDLITAVFADRMDAYAAAVTEALADPDPWHGFIGYIHAVCAMQAADRGFADVLTMTFPAAKALEARRAEAYDRLLELITRAKNTGHLRDDFTHRGRRHPAHGQRRRRHRHRRRRPRHLAPPRRPHAPLLRRPRRTDPRAARSPKAHCSLPRHGPPLTSGPGHRPGWSGAQVTCPEGSLWAL